MKRILFTGSRDWTDDFAVAEALASHCFGEDCVVVHGACPTGADKIASDMCKNERIKQEPHPANWDTHGRRAGFIRNSEMVNSGINLCVAFVKNKSRGTMMTVELCRKAGIPVETYEA